MKKFLIIIIIQSSFLSIACGAFNYKPKKIKIKKNRTVTLPFQKTIIAVEKNFANTNCRKNEYFSSCFNWTENKCKQMSKKSFQYCKAQQLSKKVFKSEDEALIYFSRIGRCVGNKMDKEVTAYKINSQKCKDVRLWL